MNIFHPYVLCFFFILLSQCSPLALGEQSTYIFFASPASPHREFCSSFQRHLRFCLFTRLSFTMYEYVSSPCSVFCYHSIPACSCSVSKVTHLHNFCITCLTKQRSLFRFSQKIAFLPYHTCLSFIMYEYVSSPCSLFLVSFCPIMLPLAQQGNPPTHF